LRLRHARREQQARVAQRAQPGDARSQAQKQLADAQALARLQGIEAGRHPPDVSRLPENRQLSEHRRVRAQTNPVN
jgi:hypothetical protein